MLNVGANGRVANLKKAANVGGVIADQLVTLVKNALPEDSSSRKACCSKNKTKASRALANRKTFCEKKRKKVIINNKGIYFTIEQK